MSVGLRDALVRVMLDETPETAIAVLDWAAHAGLLDEIDRAELASMVPSTRGRLVTMVAERCDSFPESIARTRLLAAGHRVRAQVPLDGFGPIDLVIDDRVALEIDGREFHADTFEHDSAKSAGDRAGRATSRCARARRSCSGTGTRCCARSRRCSEIQELLRSAARHPA